MSNVQVCKYFKVNVQHCPPAAKAFGTSPFLLLLHRSKHPSVEFSSAAGWLAASE